jgi:putative membrane protein
MSILLKWLMMALAIIITALWLALFLGIINMALRPILILITLPINILTLGLFTFVINALLVLLSSSVIKGFEVNGFWTAMLFSIVLSIISYLLNIIFATKKK